MTQTIERRITVGNLISTGVSLLSALVVLFGGVFWVGAQGQRLDDHTKRIEANSATIAAIGERVRAIETSTARQDERLLLILDVVRKIEVKLEREITR